MKIFKRKKGNKQKLSNNQNASKVLTEKSETDVALTKSVDESTNMAISPDTTKPVGE